MKMTVCMCVCVRNVCVVGCVCARMCCETTSAAQNWSPLSDEPHHVNVNYSILFLPEDKSSVQESKDYLLAIDGLVNLCRNGFDFSREFFFDTK